MTTLALNNLWTYLQGLALSQSDKEWLANKLIMSANTATSTSEERKARFLELAGSWSETAEGEEFYQMMRYIATRNVPPTVFIDEVLSRAICSDCIVEFVK